MNVKLWSVVVVIIVVLAGAGVYLSSHQSEADSRTVIIAMVNEDGSGVFASNDHPGLTFDASSAKLWEDLTVATPGPSSIQHMMMMNFVTQVLGYQFKLAGTSSGEANTVYYTVVAPGNMASYLVDGKIVAGIAWEPNYSNIINTSANNAYSVGNSLALWKAIGYDGDHPCCVVVANREFAESNSNAVLRFLSGYVASVQWVNAAIDAGGPNYQTLVESVKKNTGITNEITIGDALEQVKYTYSLDNLAAGLVTMIKTYESLGLLKNTMADLGFTSEADFAHWLINNSYLNQAAGRTPTDYTRLTSPISIDVGVLANDVHQIAPHIGVEQGIFTAYGVSLNLSTFSVGGDVVNAVLAGHINIGFAGAPPTVLNSINNW